jgi:hypothetical protein
MYIWKIDHTPGGDMSKSIRWFILASAVALVGVACGSNGYGGGSSNANAAGGGGSGFSVTSPANGAKVTQPFSVQVSTNQKLGAPSTGNDHFHLYFDGNQTNYTICASTTCQVSGLSPGKHVIQASLRHADHSPAGPTDTITVYVKGSGSGGSGSGGSGSGGGGGGY